jgi:hypothetical protein
VLILLAGIIEFVHIEQDSALFTFLLGQVLLYLVSQIIWENETNENVKMRMTTDSVVAVYSCEVKAETLASLLLML